MLGVLCQVMEKGQTLKPHLCKTDRSRTELAGLQRIRQEQQRAGTLLGVLILRAHEAFQALENRPVTRPCCLAVVSENQN